MRYYNWDVLLFPDQSRIPIQEFDTKCHAMYESDLQASSWALEDTSVNGNFESMTKKPLLTCFIASLAPRTPFRVSIHSWTKPAASSLLKSHKLADEPVVFQARIYIDGYLQSTRLFGEGALWPEVIDTKDGVNGGRSTDLCFPFFHPEILQQATWHAGERLGRIRITLSEGVLLGSPRHDFDRFRDIVCFSFQHAPQDILEYSAVAWPNGKMFQSAVKDIGQPVGMDSSRLRDHDAHAHTPYRAQVKQYPIRSRFAMEDPFMEPVKVPPSDLPVACRRNSTDASMPDYVSETRGHSRASTQMSVAWPRRDFQKHMDEAAVDEIIHALSPTKKEELMHALSPGAPASEPAGLQAPSNTPVAAEQSRQASPRASLPKCAVVTPPSFSSTGLNPQSKRRGSISRVGSSGVVRHISTGGHTSAHRLSPARGVEAPDGRVLQPPTAATGAYKLDRERSSSFAKRKRSLSSVTNEKSPEKILVPSSPRSEDSCAKSSAGKSSSTELQGVAIKV